ncbi:MAG TPA: PAS domain S-box protein [Desulfosporosinus sp.]|nr:PAS domain S-box protein [Desulfosporosinus sp.]
MNDSSNSTQEDIKRLGSLLSSQKNNYLEIFRNLSKPVILLTKDHKIQELNCAAVELFRVHNIAGADGCGKKDVLEMIPWLTREVTRFTADFKQKELFTKEIHTDQGSRYFEVELIQISDANGTLVFLNDITEYTRTEAALRESESWERTITEVTQYAIVFMDDQGYIIHWNHAAERLFGYTSEEVLGRELHKFIVPEKYFAAFIRGFSGYPLTGQGNINDQVLKLFALKKGGTKFAIELSLSAIQIKGCWHAVGVIKDISSSKKSQEQLRKLSQAIEQSSSTVVITDLSGDIEYVNPKFQELTGYALSEAIGKNPRFLKSGEQMPEEYQRMWNMLTSGKEWRGEFHNKKMNGELFWEFDSIAPVKDKDGQITHFVAVKEDITERKLAQKLLGEQNQKMQAELEMAGIVQRKLLPVVPAGISKVSFAWRFKPSIYISGDMLNIFQLDQSHIGFYILDVMGHGISAALRAIALNYFLKPLSFLSLGSEEYADSGAYADVMLQPSLTLELLNERFTDESLINLCTVFYGVIDTQQSLLTYARAGHCPPLLVHQSGGIEELCEGGPVIGISKNLSYKNYSVKLEPEDRICLYTDGVIEAQDQQSLPYTKERLVKLIGGNGRKLNINQLAEQVLQDVNRYMDNVESKDDLAFFVIKYDGG